MPTIPKRSSYEARILLVPLGFSGSTLVATMASNDLTNVMILVNTEGRGLVKVRDINGGPGSENTETIGEITSRADMMVLVGSDLSEVPIEFASMIAGAARDMGLLLAGVLVDQQKWDDARGATAMIMLRRELDMLVSVREAALAASLIDVLKGGWRSRLSDIEA